MELNLKGNGHQWKTIHPTQQIQPYTKWFYYKE